MHRGPGRGAPLSEALEVLEAEADLEGVPCGVSAAAAAAAGDAAAVVGRDWGG